MLPLELTARTHAEVFDATTRSCKDAEERKRLLKTLPRALQESAAFDVARRSELRRLDPSPKDSYPASKDELRANYRRLLSGGKSVRREIYDELTRRSSTGRCCYCGCGRVDELDHFLPKSAYPLLAVDPSNLVPSCHFCNSKRKLSRHPWDGDGILDPAVDDAHACSWLRAVVNPSGRNPIRFEVRFPASADPLLGVRVAYHFEFFQLNSTFLVELRNELATIVAFVERDDRVSASDLVDELRNRAREATTLFTNTPRGAFFDALAEGIEARLFTLEDVATALGAPRREKN